MRVATSTLPDAPWPIFLKSRYSLYGSAGFTKLSAIGTSASRAHTARRCERHPPAPVYVAGTRRLPMISTISSSSPALGLLRFGGASYGTGGSGLGGGGRPVLMDVRMPALGGGGGGGAPERRATQRQNKASAALSERVRSRSAPTPLPATGTSAYPSWSRPPPECHRPTPSPHDASEPPSLRRSAPAAEQSVVPQRWRAMAAEAAAAVRRRRSRASRA